MGDMDSPPYACSDPDCPAEFETVEKWELHLINVHYPRREQEGENE